MNKPSKKVEEAVRILAKLDGFELTGPIEWEHLDELYIEYRIRVTRWRNTAQIMQAHFKERKKKP